MDGTSGRSDFIADAARDLQDQQGPAQTYAMATGLAVDNVAGCQAASLTLIRRDRKQPTFVSVAATSPVAHTADHLQEQLGEGACLTAIDVEDIVHCPSLAYDERWPHWGPAVVSQTGWHSVLSVHLFTHAATVGALNLYAPGRDGFTRTDRVDALALSAHIAVAVASAEKVDNLGTALSSRTVIGQAVGILIERYELRPEVAFSALVRAAGAQQVKVLVLAEELVRTGRLRGLERRTDTHVQATPPEGLRPRPPSGG